MPSAANGPTRLEAGLASEGAKGRSGRSTSMRAWAILRERPGQDGKPAMALRRDGARECGAKAARTAQQARPAASRDIWRGESLRSCRVPGNRAPLLTGGRHERGPVDGQSARCARPCCSVALALYSLSAASAVAERGTAARPGVAERSSASPLPCVTVVGESPQGAVFCSRSAPPAPSFHSTPSPAPSAFSLMWLALSCSGPCLWRPARARRHGTAMKVGWGTRQAISSLTSS